MTDEKFEFVDREYGQSVRVNPSRQIKTRSISFNNIYDKFKKFIRGKIDQYRLKRLEDKLEKKVNDTFEEQYTRKNFEGKIAKNAEAIARLEEKIKILSKEDVPTNYVSRRAIKLRKAMMDNLEFICRDCYTISRELYVDPGFEDEESKEEMEPVLSPMETMQAAAIPSGDVSDVSAVEKPLDRQDIVDAINSELDAVESKQDSASAVEEKEDFSEEPVIINREEVRSAVEEAFKKLEEEQADVEQEEHKGVVESVDNDSEKIRVSRNNSTPVDSTRFDENGNRIRRKKYDYTPMTDDEIRESQIKLGFDENGNLINDREQDERSKSLESLFEVKDTQVRDVPVVVEDRNNSSLDLDLEDGQSMFEIVEQPEEKKETPVAAVNSASDEKVGMSIDAYTALKEKILLLQKQKAESQQSRINAQRKAEESAAKVQDARKQVEMTQASYNERIERLRSYAASLEADCDENARYTAEAEKKVQENENLAREQMSEADRNRRIIGEIDSMFEDKEEEKQVTALRVI